jgi:hypothetical protein
MAASPPVDEGNMSETDTIRFKCHHCGAGLRAPADLAGSPFRCPTCKRPTQVPERSATAPGPVASAAPDREPRTITVVTGLAMLLLGCAIGFSLGRGFAGRTEGTSGDAPAIAAPGAGPANMKSHFERVDGTAISGWVWNPDRPDAPVAVDVYDGDRLLASLPADEFRQDLLDAKMGNGRHGFSYPTPAAVKDGKPHTIRVLMSATKTELGGSPRAFSFAGS